MLAALTFALQVVMGPLPNIEPVSLLVILFAVTFGWKSLYFNKLANLANSISLAALAAIEESLAIALFKLLATNDSLFVRAPTIAIK